MSNLIKLKLNLSLFTQTLKAVQNLHANFIVHGDLTLNSILVTSDMCIKLVDFGYSTYISNPNQLMNLFSGTALYLAPEIIKKKKYNGINY